MGVESKYDKANVEDDPDKEEIEDVRLGDERERHCRIF